MSLNWSALQILDALQDFVYLKDMSGKNVFVNDAYCNFLALPKESVIGKTDAELLPPSLAKNCKASDAMAVEKRVPIRTEECDSTDGRERYFETIKTPLLQGGSVIGILGISREITSHKAVQKSLAESEARYRLLIETSPHAIIQMDPSGRILLANKRALAVTGFSDASHLVGQNASNFFVSSELPKFSAALDELSKSGYTSFEAIFRKKDGSTFPGEVSATLIENDGKPDSIIGMVRDITLQKNTEQALVRYSMELEKMVEEKTAQLREKERMATIGEIAAMVGHDLRNPLQVLTNSFFLNEMEAKHAPKEFQEIAEMMGLPKVNETIRRQIVYMDKIVSDLQDFARDMVPKRADTNLADLITESFPPSIPTNIAIKTDFSVMSAYVDCYMIRRAVSNLMNNAVQAMPLGGTLTITTCREDGAVAIKIADTGCGIDDRMKANLFRPLATSKSRGMGMGLVVVKKMVELHCGTIDVESKIGDGTTFTIKLPDKRP